MSRNWTPREMYLIDLMMECEGNGSLRKGLDSMVFVTPNGEKMSLFSDEKKKVMGMFKELGFLFGDNLYVLWQTTQEHPIKRKRILQATEEELEKLEQEMMQNATNSFKLSELTAKQEELQNNLEEKMDRWMYLEDLAAKIAAQ